MHRIYNINITTYNQKVYNTNIRSCLDFKVAKPLTLNKDH